MSFRGLFISNVKHIEIPPLKMKPWRHFHAFLYGKFPLENFQAESWMITMETSPQTEVQISLGRSALAPLPCVSASLVSTGFWKWSRKVRHVKILQDSNLWQFFCLFLVCHELLCVRFISFLSFCSVIIKLKIYPLLFSTGTFHEAIVAPGKPPQSSMRMGT